MAGQVNRLYKRTVKLAWDELAWDLPRSFHTWLVTHLLGCRLASARVTIMARFIAFLARPAGSWPSSR